LGAVVHALSSTALPAARAARGADGPSWACFASLSPWEVVDARGRKVVGLAQRRTRDRVLLVGGTLLAPVAWHLLASAMGQADGVEGLERVTADVDALTTTAIDIEHESRSLSRAIAAALQP
jgi:lipoate-protein ligase A